MQAAQYLTTTRGLAASGMRICYERAESLCHLLSRPLLLYVTLVGQFRYSLSANKLTATMEIAKRVYFLAEEQNEPALMIGACSALAVTHYFSGNFEASGQCAIRGVQIWRSGCVQSPVEDVGGPEVSCLCHEALFKWHIGEIASYQATIEEAISFVKEINDMHGLAIALHFAAIIAYFRRDPAEVERLALEVMQLSTRHNFAHWLAVGTIFRGWARSSLGDGAQGISLIEHAMEDLRANGAIMGSTCSLALKAEALHLADRTSEALDAIWEAQELSERSGERWWCVELHRLRAVFLTAIGADETQIEALFCEAIGIARDQKSVSLEKRAEATYVEYRLEKASASTGHGFRLPLC
jgi:predicted ATPase